MPTRRELIVGLGAAMVASAAGGDAEPEVYRFMQAGIDEGAYPGCALVASRGGRIRLERYLGTCRLLKDSDAHVGPGTIHPLYSYSKLISGTVIAMAVERKLVDYDTPVARWLPEFGRADKERITIRHLLTHSAGIPNPPNFGYVRTPEEWRKALEAVCAAPLEWEPGSRTAYHGISGQFVAAEAVLRQAGASSWDRLCHEWLFGPIGARTLSFATPGEASPTAITPQPAKTPATYFDALALAGHPAGGCHGTPRDALKVLQLHLNRGVWRGKRLLSTAVLDEMHTVQYRTEIAAARAAGREPAHEPWGLGPLLRDEGPAAPSLGWFGFMNQTSPGIFGHAGIDTVIGIADPATGITLFFATTDSPKPPEKTVPLRNGVTDRVFAALRPAPSRSASKGTP